MNPKVTAAFSATPPLDEAFLRQELANAKIELPAERRPFVEASDLQGRYGFPLPAPLVELWQNADERMIENAKIDRFRYVRVAPGGWEPPEMQDGYPYFISMLQRFEWNAFSNMQFLERLTGLAPLGWDERSDRLEVATVHPDAPVFFLDHETGNLLEGGCIAHSLDDFLRVAVGDEEGLSPQAVALASDGSYWARQRDGHAYLERRGKLHTWPPFLWARHAWIVGEICFASAAEHLKQPEVRAFDFAFEAPLLGESEPLALYWLLRSILLNEQAVLDETAQRCVAHSSPFVRALARFVRETPELSPEGFLAKGRARAEAYRDQLLVSEGFDASQF